MQSWHWSTGQYSSYSNFPLLPPQWWIYLKVLMKLFLCLFEFDWSYLWIVETASDIVRKRSRRVMAKLILILCCQADYHSDEGVCNSCSHHSPAPAGGSWRHISVLSWGSQEAILSGCAGSSNWQPHLIVRHSQVIQWRESEYRDIRYFSFQS